MDLEKLKKLQSQSRVGGKSVPRHKLPRKTLRPGASGGGSTGDDKKLQTTLKKLGTQPVQGIEEVNMFKDGDRSEVLHFPAPKVHAALSANTFVVYGQGQNKDLTELVPGILNQLGPDNLAHLRRIAEQYQSQVGALGAGGAGGVPGAAATAGEAEEKKEDGEAGKEGDGDDDVPDLVDSFEDAAKAEESKLEEIS